LRYNLSYEIDVSIKIIGCEKCIVVKYIQKEYVSNVFFYEKNCCMIRLRCLSWTWHGTQYFQQLYIVISRGKEDGNKGNHCAKGPHILAHDLFIKDEN
jgi:hypothetical protein